MRLVTRAESEHLSWRVASGLIALLFALAAFVQWNDPDPLRWMAIYTAAALVAAGEAARYRAPMFAATTAAVALVWAATLAPEVLRAAAWAEIFAPAGMLGPGVEETREMLGLLLVAAWMASTAWRSRRLPL